MVKLIYLDTWSKWCIFLVWIQLACAFRYGREDLDVIGVSFRKDIWIKRIQMYPFEGTKTPNTPMQDALLKKAGDQGHAFTFDVNSHLCIKHWKKTINDVLHWCLFCSVSDSSTSSMLSVPSTSTRGCREGTVAEKHAHVQINSKAENYDSLK